MGTTDSTCCGAKTSHIIPPDTDRTELNRQRKMHNNHQLKSPQPGTLPTIKSEGEYTSIPTNKVITALTIYQQHALDLNKNHQNQHNTLMQNFIEEITEINTNNNGTNHLHIDYQSQMPKSPSLTPNTKKCFKKRVRKYNSVSTQIAILNSEAARAQSLLLCIKTIEIEYNNSIVYFGFLSFLRNHLDDLAVEELFNKFPKSQSLSSSQFVSLLTLTVIIYKIKIYQLKTGNYNQTEIDGEKIKAAIEHLAIWCVRRFGKKQRKIENVSVFDDLGNQIQGKDYLYKLYFTKHNYKQHLCDWVQEYVDNDGIFQ